MHAKDSKAGVNRPRLREKRDSWSFLPEAMKTAVVLIVALCALQALVHVAFARPNPNQGHTGLRMAAGKFDRIFIIQFENQPFEFVKDDPNFKKYAQMGLHMTNYFGVTHPSQPNVRPPIQLAPFSSLRSIA